MILATVLFLCGLGFVLAEVFFPSLGLLAVLAAACFLIADMTAFSEGGQVLGWTFIVLQVVLIPLTVRLAFLWLPKLPFGRRMLLSQPSDVGAGLPDLRHLLGREGRAETELAPSGRAVFGTERHSVVARAGVIPPNAPVVVVAVEGSEVRVRSLSDERPTSSVGRGPDEAIGKEPSGA